MKRQNLFAIACVATTAAATLVGNVGSASATALYGIVDFSSNTGSPSTLGIVKQGGIDLNLDPGTVNIAVDAAEGTLKNFSSAFIFSSSLLTQNYNGAPTLLLDFDGGDSNNSFSYTKIAAFDIARGSIDVNLEGFFIGSAGEKTFGSGVLTFQKAGKTTSEFLAALDGGTPISNMTFSGSFIASQAVPEPTALAGLGLVAGVFAVSRRRKANNN